MNRKLLTAAVFAVTCIAASCGEASHGSLWTREQAESITSIRGMSVRVRSCRGIGAEESGRFARFDCVAGGRTSLDRYDTVGIFYVLEPRGRYRGPTSPHRLARARFVGGPGIP